MRRSLLFVALACVAIAVVLAASSTPAEASRIRVNICLQGQTSGTWILTNGYGGGTMRGTLYTVRPFRGATLYHLEARLSGDATSGRIVGDLKDVRGKKVASVRGSYRPSATARVGSWKATIYPVQNLSQITDRRSYIFPGKMSGTFSLATLTRSTTFTGQFRICL